MPAVRRVAVVVSLLVSAGLAGLARPGDRPEPPAGPVLLLPCAKGPVRLRVDVVIDGQPPAAAWDAFLDRLFDYFDRDGDGFLSRDEAGRMVPLPLPGRRELTIDFARLDADGDGKASRAEWKGYCRGNGCGPVVVVVEPSSADDLRLGELFFRRLDADGDGKLTRAELRRAPRALHKFDLNDDEFLDLAELLAFAPSAPPPPEAGVKLAGAGEEAEAVLRLDVGTKTPAAAVVGKGSERFRLAAARVPGGLHRLGDPEGRWAVTFRTARVVPAVGSAGEFLLSQFKTTLGDRTALTKADLEQDPTLGGLGELFRYADRDGDNRLSLAELEAYLKLVEAGVRAQVWIKVTDRGRNPFPSLDADGDGRLSYRELAGACELLAGDAAEVNRLRRQFQLTFGGPAAPSWGGVPLPAPAKRPRPGPADGLKVPRWFRAMDRNGDGVVSPREFVGPPEVFRKLDLDGDGVISAEEAARAGER
jgi:Ca2+-binding EF-hand superfamily protein